MRKISLPIFVTITWAVALWLPNLFAQGMFVDGVYNALFAHNILLGVGSMWAPHTADYLHPNYWDNPQLSAVLLAQWYKALGDHYWVEKLHSLFCALLQLALVAGCWRVVTREDSKTSAYYWLPCLMLLISPVCGWAYSNNLMENTMSVFTTGAVILFLFYMHTNSRVGLFSCVGGGFIFLALLTKGPVALFPLAVPFLFLWTNTNYSWKQCLGYSLIQLLVVVVLFVVVFSLPEPHRFLQNYLAVQLLPVLNNKRGAGGSHFTILLELVLMLLPLLSLAVLSFRQQKNNLHFKTAVSFLLVGLSASLPIMLSAKQNKHYLIPSLPIFALGISFWVVPAIIALENKLHQHFNKKHRFVLLSGCSVVIVYCFYLCFQNAGVAVRDKDLLSDIKRIESYTPGTKVIFADWALYDNWALRAYLNRLYDKKICMPDEAANTIYYLTASQQRGDNLPDNAIKLFAGNRFDLYQTE